VEELIEMYENQRKKQESGRFKSQGGEKKRVISARLAEEAKSAREEDD
jgi:hypothetical protein